MKYHKILLLLANGFEILEASAFIDVMGWNLEEGDNSTKLYSCGLRKELISSFRQHFIVDCTVREVDIGSFDTLVIPGGFKNFGYYQDAYNEEFLNLIRGFKSQNKIIASVCVGALPLAKSGILKKCSGICGIYSGIWGQIQRKMRPKTVIFWAHSGYFGKFCGIWGQIKQYLVKHKWYLWEILPY